MGTPASSFLPVALGLADDVLDLRNTPLADIETDEVVLSDFENPFGQFSIAEVVVDGASGDTTAPVVTVPDSPVTVVAAGPNGAAVSFIATAHDAVDGPVPVECDPPSGSTFVPGKTTVVCSATDAAGNSAARNFTVLVTLTASGLCKLTGSYVATSEQYQALPPGAVRRSTSSWSRPANRSIAWWTVSPRGRRRSS
jgi:HYR domain